MRSLMQQMPYLGPVEKKGFGREKPLGEGPLRGARLLKAFSSLPGVSEERHSRFERARSLVMEAGGSIDVLSDAKGRLRLKARVEIPTSDRRRDMGMQSLVAGMGFELTFEGRVESGEMKRFYVISENRSSDRLEQADGTAERLVRVCRSLGLLPAKESPERAQPCGEQGEPSRAASGSR